MTSVDIKVGLSRSSVGAHAKVLLDQGLLVKDLSNGWHISSGHIVEVAPVKVTPIDIAGECIRKMIDVK